MPLGFTARAVARRGRRAALAGAIGTLDFSSPQAGALPVPLFEDY